MSSAEKLSVRPSETQQDCSSGAAEKVRWRPYTVNSRKETWEEDVTIAGPIQAAGPYHLTTDVSSILYECY